VEKILTWEKNNTLLLPLLKVKWPVSKNKPKQRKREK
jgi:hypothetical protein